MTARDRFRNNLRETHLFGRRVLIAVSGGADSVALLRLLKEFQAEARMTLFAAHMEHGIRAGASAADCQFVEALCASQNIPLLVRHADIPAEAARAGEGLETCARRVRHAFLREARARFGADVIALAHHADDQAETVLMHLLRGSGLVGAAGMRPRDGEIVRPLLSFTRAEIRAYLSEIGQPFREDATNAVSDNPRNALRNEVFPRLASIYPGATQALNRFARLAADEDACLARYADEFWRSRARSYAGARILRLTPEDDVCLVRRAIRRAMSGLDSDDVERARTAVGRAALSAGGEAWRIGDALYLLPPFSAPEPVPVPSSGAAALSGVCALSVAAAAPIPLKGNPFAQTLDDRALEGALLRTRREGDFIRPLGMGGRAKSLSDYLTDRKFPRPLRDRMPVVARGGEILWAVGAGISESARVDGSRAARRLSVEIAQTV